MPGSIELNPSGNNPAPVAVPSISVYDRLEPRPRKAKDFERAMRAEVRDPLWMLTRQWQFGEFKGEDTGSPIFAKFEIESGELTSFKAKDAQNFQSYSPDFPLEPLIEGQDIPLDLSTRIQIGHFWFKLLTENNLTNYKVKFIAKYGIGNPAQLTDSAEIAMLQANPELLNLLSASFNRVCDGGTLISYLKTASTNAASDGIALEVPAHRALINSLGTQLLNWYSSLYQQSSGTKSAWDPERLEYRFSVKAKSTNNSDITLSAPEYYEGKLDWYSFEKLSGSSPANNVPFVKKETIMMTELEFPGMPNSRFWQFEDGHVDLGNIDVRTTDLAKLIMTEFALVYGNDWSVVPLHVPVGTHTKIRSLIIKDVFGQSTLIEAAGKGADDAWQKWRMYNLNTQGTDLNQQADNALFVPPVLLDILESEPIEKVSFIRDEMANMVWAIEKIIPNELGGGQDGAEAAVRLRAQYEINKPGTVSAPSVAEKTDIPLEYTLMSTVPENWIPMVPVNVSSDPNKPELKLQRAAMPRYIKGYKPSAVRPRTFLMQEVSSPYYINDEELTRSGVVVSSNYQRVRWHDGRVIVWVGRKKEVGKGEGNSRLKFDQLEFKE